VRSALVTGGAGFIGSHLTASLLEAGWRVTVLDNLSTGVREHVPPAATLFEGDVADPRIVHELFAAETFDAVLHVAGQASISRSFATPERDLTTNVLGTLNVLEACVTSGVGRLVHASSMTVYGEPELVPTPETAPATPVSYYGVTKYAAERYVQIAGAHRDADLTVTSLRMFNVYGERQALTNPYQGVLAIFLGNVLRNEPITIRSDGEQTRDFVHVDDVVRAWLTVLDEASTFGEVFNVGGGRETSINELADAVLGAAGSTRSAWRIEHAPTQAGDQRRSQADTRRIRDAIGWEPQVELSEGIERTLAWSRRQHAGQPLPGLELPRSP
jgi:UDP-glucose 4-epimerase